MLQLIPFLVDVDPLKAEIRAEVDDLRLRQDRVADKRGAEPLGGRREDHVRLRCQRFHIIIHAFLIDQAEHVSVDVRIVLIDIASGAVPHNLGVRMLQKKADNLRSRIPRGPDYTCFNHFNHPVCNLYHYKMHSCLPIILQHLAGNVKTFLPIFYTFYMYIIILYIIHSDIHNF